MMTNIQPNRLAECVGLWLAEGDSKTKSEITFTNNSESLVRLFYNVLVQLFPDGKFRLYIYSPTGKESPKIKNCLIREYCDIRARKPYYILRYASTKDLAKWKKLVARTLKKRKHFSDILRGFFAGEGNIKTPLQCARTIRIAQKQQIEIVNTILDNFKISYRFSARERAYVITGYENWKKFYEYKLFTLHPKKRNKFLIAWKSYRQIHYPKNFIKNNIISKMMKPVTSRELAILFNRNQTTIQELLTELKRAGKVIDYRTGSYSYWIRSDMKTIIISERKAKILKIIKIPRRTSEISKKMSITWKATNRRLHELKNLGLAKEKNYLWYRPQFDKKVIVL